MAEAEQLLADVVHDLRQPLGTIQSSTFLLNWLLRDAPPEIHVQLRIIERQAKLAACILQEAAAQLCPAPAQHAEAGALEFTKSQTAAVT